MSATYDSITNLPGCERYLLGDPQEPTLRRNLELDGWWPRGLKGKRYFCGEHAGQVKGAAA